MRITYSRLKVDTLSTLATRTVAVSKKPEYSALTNGNPLLNQLTNTSEDFFHVFNKDIYSGMGEEVQTFDINRDNFYRGIYKMLFSMSNMNGMSIQQDAKDLLTIFDSYGYDIPRLSYGDESAYMNKLIEALDKPEVIAKLVKLNLDEAFTLLKKAQEDFETIFASQTGANATLRQMQSATSLKGQLINDLRNYLGMVSAMRTVDTWKGLYNELNELVKAANGSNLAPAVEPTPPPAQP